MVDSSHDVDQLAAMSCHSATANQVRLALHTAPYWLMLAVRDAVPQRDPLANAEFATIRERLIKIGARIVEHAAPSASSCRPVA
jgi:Transposase DDE domain group 1